MKLSSSSGSPVAYSYVRFSHPDQAKGDSLRRQTEAAADWCQRNKVRLDTATTLHDLGRSAFAGEHRNNPDRHALAAFLKLVEEGKVLRGSYLIIENLDRLSREHIQPALLLALNLLQAGIRVVQLKPTEMVFDDKSDTLPVMMMMMELSRGHGESAIKSERVGAAWAEKKKAARKNGTILTHRLPAWVEERGGKLRLIQDRAAVVKLIFHLAASGYGCHAIVAKLNKEKVPPFGVSGRWVRSYVGYILKDRRAVGEFQPRRRRVGKKGGGSIRRVDRNDGEPIPNYYPAAVTEDEWVTARAGAAQRRLLPGATGKYVNVFAGLLRNARDGDTYFCTTRTYRHPQKGRVRWRVLINTAADARGAKCWSFPFVTFERAILSMLAEINPRELLDQADDEAEEVQALAGDLARVENSIAMITAELDEHGESPTLFRRLRDKEVEKRRLVERLSEARQKAANPLREAWGECKTLLAALDKAPDANEARLRLRAVVRRIIESVWLLVVPRGLDRLCAVQIWFGGGERCRNYLVWHRPPNGLTGAEGSWWAWSLASVVKSGDLDLRRPEDARDLEEALLAADLHEEDPETPSLPSRRNRTSRKKF
jgi:DNA invertase Pin-like site-specific DNA recombinase